MMINTEALVSITEANQNFSKVARLVDKEGSAIILKNNVPRYLVLSSAKHSGLKLHRMTMYKALHSKSFSETALPLRNWQNEEPYCFTNYSAS